MSEVIRFNYIAFNPLHDKAIENGLLTITTDFHLKILPILLKQTKNDWVNSFFIKYQNKEMILPSRFLRDTEFLKYHHNEHFK